MNLTHRDEILKLRDRGALFVLNHSGGKDSQTQTIELLKLVPPEQVMVIHAALPEVDWAGIPEHIESTVPEGIPVVYTKAKKTFFEMVDHRQHWPSPSYRQCTSDLKRGPIEREIRRWLKANVQYNGLIVNVVGIRAEESSRRAKANPFLYSARNSKAGREWYDWLPIHDYKTEEVFGTIADAGETPHWAYSKGMSRLSCVFCIMANKSDLTTAAKLEPMLYARYVRKEQELGKSMLMPSKTHGVQYLPDITGVEIDPIDLAAQKAKLTPKARPVLDVPSIIASHYGVDSCI